MTTDEVIAIYNAQKERYEKQSDASPLQATRTEVHAALQLEEPPPDAEDDEDREDHHQRQKKHLRELWKKTDELISKAGITPKPKKGKVS